jgi:DNA-binding MarR family transcriptional regulator
MKGKNKLANDTWEALFRAQATIAREFAARDVWGGLMENEYGVLYALATAPSGLRMSELGGDVLLSQAGLSRLVARLEARGLVQRRTDPEDGRASVLRLSAAGIRQQRRVGAAHGRHVAERLTTRLDEAQLVALRDLCRELSAPDRAEQEIEN